MVTEQNLNIDSAGSMPDTLEIQLQNITALFASGSLPEARAASTPLETRLFDEEEWKKVYKCLRSVGDNSRAEMITSRYLSRDPCNERVTVEMLALLGELNRTDDANNIAKRFSAQCQESALLMNALAACNLNAKRYLDAMTAARKAVDLDLKAFDYRLNLIYALRACNHHIEFRRQVDALGRLPRESPRDKVRLAEVALSAGRNRLAAVAISEALQSSSVPEYYLGEMARVLLALGKYKVSFQVLNTINIEKATDVKFVMGLRRVAEALERKLLRHKALADIVTRIEIRLVQLTSSTAQNQSRIKALQAELLLGPSSPIKRQTPIHTAINALRTPFKTLVRRGIADS